MIQGIASAPKDRAIMVIEQDGTHVEVRWQSYSERGETLWEGWCYVDPILAEVSPEGPADPLHWYDKPVPGQKPKAGRKEPTREEWREWVSRNHYIVDADYRGFPGTPAQAVAMARVGFKQPNHFMIVNVQLRQFAEASGLRPVTMRADTEIEIADTVRSYAALCPVIREQSTGENFLITPDGKIEQVRIP
ncbi:hypothetical protein ACQKOE_07105 [Novosphingobium sp. NPDC080210]|uniref:hypothetical protein n=1 Tax=Novosphingobium sp. NPDC080210 TaxID=3390596 RepID=UPI003CFBED88